VSTVKVNRTRLNGAKSSVISPVILINEVILAQSLAVNPFLIPTERLLVRDTSTIQPDLNGTKKSVHPVAMSKTWSLI
jgi:hypothetical protein